MLFITQCDGQPDTQSLLNSTVESTPIKRQVYDANSTIQTGEGVETKSTNEWNSYHTTLAIIVRIFGDLTNKCIIVYYRDYERALNLNNAEFSWVIISGQMGALLAVLLLPFINAFLPKLQNKITVFGFLCGLFASLFFIPSQIQMTHAVTLIYCCTDTLLFGVSFFIHITSIMDLAAITTEKTGKQGAVISLLSLSWTFASLFYILVGFMIDYVNWWFSFVLFGSIVSISSLFSSYIFDFDIDTSSALNINDARSPVKFRSPVKEPNVYEEWRKDFGKIVSSKILLLIFSVSIIMGLFSGSFMVIMSSIWMEDVFKLTAFQVGAVSLSIFFGELFAAFSISMLVDKYGVFNVSILPCGVMLLVSIICCVLSVELGKDVGGISIVVCISFLMYFGWEAFYIIHQVLCINNSPSKKLISFMLLINFVCLNTGIIVGTQISPMLWNHGKGLDVITVIWIVCVGLSFAIYLILKSLTDKTDREKYTEIDDV